MYMKIYRGLSYNWNGYKNCYEIFDRAGNVVRTCDKYEDPQKEIDDYYISIEGEAAQAINTAKEDRMRTLTNELNDMLRRDPHVWVRSVVKENENGIFYSHIEIL